MSKMTRILLIFSLALPLFTAGQGRLARAESPQEGAVLAASAPAQESTRRAKPPRRWASAVLVVISDFSKAKVKVNGTEYQTYHQNGQDPGMLLPAGGPHMIEVTYDGKSKFYELYLKANETRYLMLDLTGLTDAGLKQVAEPVRPPPAKEDDEEPADDEGRVTVYSNPKGEIFVDGKATGDGAPGTVTIGEGRHEVHVKFESGKQSERKIVRVRGGSRIKLFFRE